MDNTIQRQFWTELYRLRVQANYVDFLLSKNENTDRVIKAFIALTSSSSIAAWAVWKEAAFAWALLIAASQVISAVRHLFPFKERQKALSTLVSDVEDLANFAELHWHRIARGKMPEEDINELIFDVRKRKSKAVRKSFPSTTIPRNEKCLEKAETAAALYFRNTYLAGEK